MSLGPTLDIIGRRPSLPYCIHEQIQRDPAYQAVFDVFITTTEIKVAQRPSAAMVVRLMSENVLNQSLSK